MGGSGGRRGRGKRARQEKNAGGAEEAGTDRRNGGTHITRYAAGGYKRIAGTFFAGAF